jgi:hypothetical protein
METKMSVGERGHSHRIGRQQSRDAQRQEPHRIDLAVTLLMALARATAGASNVSIYSTDERPDGLRFI